MDAETSAVDELSRSPLNAEDIGQPGCRRAGPAGQTLPGYTFQGLSDAIVRVMDREGIESAHVAGISLGTIVSAMMGLRAEGRVSSLILGGATPGVDLRAKVLLHCGRLLKGVMPYMWLSSFFAWIMMPKSNHARSRQVFVREAHKLGSGEFRKWYRLIQANPGMSGAQPATSSRPALVTQWASRSSSETLNPVLVRATT